MVKIIFKIGGYYIMIKVQFILYFFRWEIFFLVINKLFFLVINKLIEFKSIFCEDKKDGSSLVNVIGLFRVLSLVVI